MEALTKPHANRKIMTTLFNVIEALFLIFVSWRCLAYYKGWQKLSPEKEERRLRVVESYGELGGVGGTLVTNRTKKENPSESAGTSTIPPSVALTW